MLRFPKIIDILKITPLMGGFSIIFNYYNIFNTFTIGKIVRSKRICLVITCSRYYFKLSLELLYLNRANGRDKNLCQMCFT